MSTSYFGDDVVAVSFILAGIDQILSSPHGNDLLSPIPSGGPEEVEHHHHFLFGSNHNHGGEKSNSQAEQSKQKKSQNEETKHRPPHCGEIFTNANLARTFRTLGREGRKGFYEGRIAEAIVEVVRARGGCLSLKDLKDHKSTFPEPISVSFMGNDVWEIPPNGQGLTALLALNILEPLLKSSRSLSSSSSSSSPSYSSSLSPSSSAASAGKHLSLIHI